jgi:hypothetical protein
MVDQRPHSRIEALVDRARRSGRAGARRAKAILHDPVRVLIGAIAVVLVVVSVPLLIGGAQRLDRAWGEFHHHRSVDEHWIRAEGTITQVRYDDGLGLQVTYRDRRGSSHRAEVHVDAPGDEGIGTRVPLRYDPLHTERVDLVGVGEQRPFGSALVAGAAIGAGVAALLLAAAVWRRRALLAVSPHPLAVLRIPLATAGVVLVVGVTAWVIGTVTLQGWTGIAGRIGDLVSTAFSDFLGVLLPVFAFAAGCLLTAWLARHRHHEDHVGVLSNAHRLIDRAAGYVPSPDEMKARDQDPAPDRPETSDRSETSPV